MLPLANSTLQKRPTVFDNIRDYRRRISKLSIGLNESGNPIEIDMDVHVGIFVRQTNTFDSILRQKTRRVTEIELEEAASKTNFPHDAAGLVASSPPVFHDDNLPGPHLHIESTKPSSSTSPCNQTSTASTTSESNPTAPSPNIEPGLFFVVTDVEPTRLKSSIKILTQQESLSSPYLSNRDRININNENQLKRDVLYAELRELIPSPPRRHIRRGGRRRHSRRQDTGEDTPEPADAAEDSSKLIKKQTQSLHALHPDAFFHRIHSTRIANISPATKDVRFGNVQVRTYATILGDHPVAVGPSLSLGWAYKEEAPLHVKEHEPTTIDQDGIVGPLVIAADEREAILRNIGYSLAQLVESEVSKMTIQDQREETVANLKSEDVLEVLH